MSILQFRTMETKYEDNEMMAQAVYRLKETDIFHLLRSSDLFTGRAAGQMLINANSQYIGWMSVCNGGYLYETTLLSVSSYDKELDMNFDTLANNNTKEAHQEFGLPDGFFVIAIRSYGDPICLSEQDSKVYLWDMEEGDFTTIWDSFFDFISDEIDGYLELLAEGELEPIPMKLLDDEEEDE